jgi:hypothetical protein
MRKEGADMIRRRPLCGVYEGFCAGWLLLVFAAWPFGLIACSQTPAPPPAQTATPAPPVAPAAAPVVPTAERPPSALMEVGEAAESLFDAALAKNWTAAEGQLEALKASAGDLPASLPKPDLVAQLHSRLDALGASVASHQRVETMDDANGITRIAAEIATKWQTRIPYEVILLDYYGRQLELGIASGKLDSLKRTTTDLRSTWNMIEHTILERGHTDDAKRFTDIVVQLEAARTPDDFVAPARAELAAVDQLQNIFR